MAHEVVDRRAQRRIGGNAGIAVRTAALQGEDEIGGETCLALRLCDLRQHRPDGVDARHHGLLGAADLLDRHRAERVGFLQPIGLLETRDLEAFAAEPHHHHAADIGIDSVSPLRALQDLVALAFHVERAAAAMGERDHAVDVGILVEQT